MVLELHITQNYNKKIIPCVVLYLAKNPLLVTLRSDLKTMLINLPVPCMRVTLSLLLPFPVK